MSAECRDIEALLSPYADGELDAAKAQRVEAHLATCASCRGVLEAWRESETALASLSPARSDVEWERLAQRVEGAVEAEERASARAAAAAAPPLRGKLRPWIWGGSGILAAAALVGLFWPWVVKSPETGVPRKTEVAAGRSEAARPAEEARDAAGNGIALRDDADALAEREIAAKRGAPARQDTPETPPPAAAAPIADGGAAQLQGVDVRRVAIAQEQKEQGVLGARLKSAENSAAPVPSPAASGKAAMPEAAGTLAKTMDEAPSFAMSEPEGGARTLTEMQDRFARLAEETVRSRTMETTGDLRNRAFARPGDGAPAVPGTASERDVAASPAAVLNWAKQRRTEGDALRAREAYAMLTGDFPGNDERAEAWFGRADLAATDALRSGQKDLMEQAAAEVEGYLGEFPVDAHRVDALAQRARLWAALAARDAAQCPRAKVARADWQAAAGVGAAFPEPAPAETGCP